MIVFLPETLKVDLDCMEISDSQLQFYLDDAKKKDLNIVLGFREYVYESEAFSETNNGGIAYTLRKKPITQIIAEKSDARILTIVGRIMYFNYLWIHFFGTVVGQEWPTLHRIYRGKIFHHDQAKHGQKVKKIKPRSSVSVLFARAKTEQLLKRPTA